MAVDQIHTEPKLESGRKTPPPGAYISGYRVIVSPEWDGWISLPPSNIEGDPETDDPHWFN